MTEASAQPRLLLASDFCRVTSHVQEIKFRQALVGEEDEEHVRGSEEQANLLLLPPDNATAGGSLAWANTSWLRQHALLAGRMVLIRTTTALATDGGTTTSSAPTTTHTIAVRLCAKSHSTNDEDDTVLILSPLAFVNLMGYPASTTRRNNPRRDVVHKGQLTVLSSSSSSSARLPMACKVTLRPWYCTTHATLNNTRSLPFPPPQSILSLGGWVIATQQAQPQQLHFYQVVQIRDELDCVLRGDVFLSNSKTQYRVEGHPNEVMCPVLPDVHDMERILLPDKKLLSSPVKPMLHPSSSDFNQALVADTFKSTSCRRSRYVPPAECIFHVVGDPDANHLIPALHHAALSRRIHVVRGLALYTYSHYQTPNNDDSNVRRSKLVDSGGWADKMAGLRQAVRDARNMAPSVLVLPDLDHEFCPLELDAGRLRTDQEQRLVTLLQEMLGTGTTQSNGSMSASSSSCLFTVPAVLVVFSTRRPLPPGPLRTLLVWESVTLQRPDPIYQKHLWQTYSGIDTTSTCMSSNVQTLLDGRSANEIVLLSKKYARAKSTFPDTRASVVDDDLFSEICATYDSTQRDTMTTAHIPTVHWHDIGGLAHVRQEIMEAISWPLSQTHLFPPGTSRSGILLFGPPGTGKTLVAKAVATESKLPFLSVKGPELLGSFVGESEANVREIFQEARARGARNKPPACILFFDELESLAPRRGDESSSGSGHVMDRVVATLLAEMDRASSTTKTTAATTAAQVSQVFCIGATNRPDLLDSALLRPGRLDRLVYLGIQTADYPNILMAQLRGVQVEGDDLVTVTHTVANALPSTMTGADLAGIVSAAVLRATHRLCDKADQQANLPENEGKSMDEILRQWSPKDLEPVVTLKDLLMAAQETTPSLTESDRAHYEKLKRTMVAA